MCCPCMMSRAMATQPDSVFDVREFSELDGVEEEGEGEVGVREQVLLAVR